MHSRTATCRGLVGRARFGAGSMSLSGQWIGQYSGTNSGLMVIDIDDRDTHYTGTACAWENNRNLQSSVVVFRTQSKGSKHHIPNVPVLNVDQSGQPLSKEMIAAVKAAGLTLTDTAIEPQPLRQHHAFRRAWLDDRYDGRALAAV